DVMSDGAFHHFAVVRSAQANQLSLYIDGEMHPNVQDALSQLSMLEINSSGVTIGDVGDGPGVFGSGPLDGTLDELAIWNRAITSREIASVAGGDIDNTSRDLRLYLPFDDGFGNVARDRSPYGLDAVGNLIWSDETPSVFDTTVPENRYLFPDDGIYKLSTTAFDADGGIADSEVAFEVANAAPVVNDLNLVDFGPYMVQQTIRFDARDLMDVGVTDDQFDYIWEVRSNNGEEIASGNKLDFNFTPGFSGRYFVSLIAVDEDGGASEPVLEVIDVAPITSVNAPSLTGTAGQAMTFDTSATSPLALVTRDDLGRSIDRTYEWSITRNSITQSSGIGPSITFVPQQVGDYIAEVTITDSIDALADVSRWTGYRNDETSEFGALDSQTAGGIFDPGQELAYFADTRLSLNTTTDDFNASGSLVFENSDDADVSLWLGFFGSEPFENNNILAVGFAFSRIGANQIQVSNSLGLSSHTLDAGITHNWSISYTAGVGLSVTIGGVTLDGIAAGDLPLDSFGWMQTGGSGNATLSAEITDLRYTQSGMASQHVISESVAISVDSANPIDIVGVSRALEGDELLYSVAGLPPVAEGVSRSFAWRVDGGAAIDQPTLSFHPSDEGTHTIDVVVTDVFDAGSPQATTFEYAPESGLTLTVDNALPRLVVDDVETTEAAVFTF
ncbi:MAG: LamG-like jellyroll fold domain-containing protein, partial [Planctomycetota bacterium]